MNYGVCDPMLVFVSSQTLAQSILGTYVIPNEGVQTLRIRSMKCLKGSHFEAKTDRVIY